MRLLAFHADGFGILARTGAEGLGPGINIFLGDNEAGKSTCLAFLRAMLTGYPSGRKERQAGQPLRGGQAGGSLILEGGPHGLLHLHRDAARQNSPGECVITSGTSDCMRCKKIAKAGQVPAFFVSPVVVWGMAGLACAGA